MEKKLELIKETIKDTQSIISILDLKARFLLAVNLAIIGGIFLLVKNIVGIDKSNLSNIDFFSFNINEKYIISFLIFACSILIIWNIIIIYRLVYHVINPRINPFEQILNVDNKYEKSPFFPLPENDCFDFTKFREQIDNYSEDDIKNIYIIELLKLSYIRHKKLENLNNIINKDFKNLLIFLSAFIVLTLILILFLKY